MARRYPADFDPPNPAVQQMGGCGAYSSHAEITEPERLMQMAIRVNWKASFDFPYMSMFIPPVTSDTEERIDFKKQKTSIAKMRAQRGRRHHLRSWPVSEVFACSGSQKANRKQQLHHLQYAKQTQIAGV